MYKSLRIKDVKIHDRFWSEYLRLVREEVLPYQWEALNDRIEGAEPSGSIRNYRIAAGLETGEYHGYVFQDTDLTKWIEAAAYRLEAFPDDKLIQIVDEMVELIEKAQQPDGYLNTYFTIKEPQNRWMNERDKHELYCAGHMIEAAVAYYEATGKEKLLHIACRFADYLDQVFGLKDDKRHGYPGHQVVEMALLRLYHATGQQRYLALSKYFIDERGQQPHYFDLERTERIKHLGKKAVEEEPYNRLMKENYEYNQAHLPVREQKKATGHAVRAVYMYTAMAELADLTGDRELLDAVCALWKNTVEKQMYITGALGSDEFGEAFSFDYDLPNDRTYAETCASVGLVFWAQRMLQTQPLGEYADVMEKALYNGTISGMSLDGKRFFYVNPLEVVPEVCARRHDTMHVESVRQKWFGCSCCPPNLARMIASIGRYIYTVSEEKIYVNQFVGSEANLKIKNQNLKLVQKGNYPWEEELSIELHEVNDCCFSLAIRIPGWCAGAKLWVNGEEQQLQSILRGGYAELSRCWKAGDAVTLRLPMPIRRMRSNPLIRSNAGKVALQRGPIVYCFEETDNGENLQDLCLIKNSKLEACFEPELLGGVTTITGKALRSRSSSWSDKLYADVEPDYEEVSIKAVPYYAWENRTPGEMLVWIRECR